jgi:hypothetical protein
MTTVECGDTRSGVDRNNLKLVPARDGRKP